MRCSTRQSTARGSMTCYDEPLDRRVLQQNVQRLGVFYGIYPDPTLQLKSAPATWFEVALHAEMTEYRPPEHPESREAFSVLMDLADYLIQRIQSHAPYGLEISDSYYLLLSTAPEGGRPRLARTVSLIFIDAGCRASEEERCMLTQLRGELSQLDVLRLDRSTGGGSK